MLYAENKDVSLHWLRAYYIYGDDTRGSSIFAKLCQAEEDRKETFPFTSGKNKYDFITIHELAKQIYMASIQANENGVINVCSGKPTMLADKVEEYIKDHGFKIRLQYGAFPDRPYDSPAVWGDNTRIKRIMEKYS